MINVEVCSDHLKTVPPLPSTVLGAAIDPGFEALILRCLEKRPEDRPRNGAVLAEAVGQLELDAWSAEDARTWWRDFRAGREDAIEAKPTGRTQLAIDVEGRN